MGLCFRVNHVFKEMPSSSSSNKMETQHIYSGHLPEVQLTMSSLGGKLMCSGCWQLSVLLCPGCGQTCYAPLEGYVDSECGKWAPLCSAIYI